MNTPTTSYETLQDNELYPRKRKYPFENTQGSLDQHQQDFVASFEQEDFATYKKNQGSGHLHGPEYQYTMCALYALKLCNDERIYDFQMTTNDNRYKVFDDIAIKVTLQDGTKRIFIMQLKHGLPQKNLTVGDFARETLRNKSYLKNHYWLSTHIDFIRTITEDNVVCIIFTNNTTNIQNNLLINLKSNCVTVKKCDDFDFLDLLVNTDTPRRDDIFSFEMDPSFKNVKFYIFSNQDNVNTLKFTVGKFLKNLIENDIYDSFDYFMRSWWSSNFILTKSDLIAKLVELSLSPLITLTSSEKLNAKAREFKKSFNDFSLIAVESSDDNLVNKIWDETDNLQKIGLITTELLLMGFTVNSNIDLIRPCLAALKFGLTAYLLGVDQNRLSWSDKYKIITNLSSLQINKLLWYLDQVPLIVKFNEENVRVLEGALKILKNSCKKKKIVLVGQLSDDFREKLKFFNVFQNLSDLFVSNCDKVFDYISENFLVSLQGREEISLRTFLKSDQNFAKLIGIKELLQMTQNSLKIGKNCANLPKNYISRRISTFSLDNRKLLEAYFDSNNTLLIVNCVKSSDFHMMPNIELTEYLKMGKEISKTIIVSTKNKCSKSEFDEVCKISGKSVYLILNMNDDRSSILLLKKGDTLPLSDLKCEEITIEEKDLLKYFDNNINFICGPIGIGKSVLLSSLSEKCPPDFWSSYINLNDCYSYLKLKPKFEVIMSKLLQIDENLIDLEKSVRNFFLRSKRLYIFLDGLDEIESESVDFILDFMKQLSTEIANIWISSRNFLEKRISESLNVIPLKIQNFNETETKRFLHLHLDKTFDIVLKSLSLTNSHHLLTVPLYLSITAESAIWNKTDRKLVPVNEICEILLKGLINFCSKKHEWVNFEKYQALALKTCLDSEDFEKLGFDTISNTSDKLGLSQNFSSEDTFALYFAALWLTKNTTKACFLWGKYFSEKYQNLRTMCDLIFLEANLKTVKLFCVNLDSDNRDRVFRNLLDLACQYNYYKSIEELIGFGVIIENGNTVLHLAAKYGTLNEQFLKTSNSLNVDLNSLNFDGESALHIASQNGDLAAVQLLVSQGAIINNLTNKGRTVLHYVMMSRNPHMGIVDLFLERGVDANIRDTEGLTWLDLAQKNSNEDLINLLKHKDLLKNTVKSPKSSIESMEVEEVGNSSCQSEMFSQKTFRKRPGTTTMGQEYENLLAAYLILKLIADKNVQDFQLSMDDYAFSNFDDIVLEVKINNSIRIYAFQIKHSSRDKVIREKNLTRRLGDFSLMKYFESVEKILNSLKNVNYLVFTNQKFGISEDCRIHFEGSDLILKVTEFTPEDLVNTSGKCYKFRIVDNSTTNLFHFDFFDNLNIYSNQMNFQSLKLLVKERFQKIFNTNDSIYHQYISFFNNWRSHQRQEKIDKIWILRVITLYILNPYIKPISVGVVDEKMKIISEAISLFRLTIVESKCSEIVRKFWNNIRFDLELEKYLLIKYQLALQEIKDFENERLTYSQLLWLANEAPLIVESNDSLSKLLQLYDDGKFIVIGNSEIDDIYPTFRNFSDLKMNINLFNMILITFSIVIQGKEAVNVEYFHQLGDDFGNLMTPSILVLMTEAPYQVGGEKEPLPEPYISRSLSKIIVKESFFDNISDKTRIFISCSGQVKSNIWNKTNVFLVENEEFEKLSNVRNNDETIHHLRYSENDNFEWIESKGSLGDLEPYIDYCYVSEKNFFSIENQNNINIISGDPGMGKSCFLRKLKNCVSPQYWTIIINMKKFSSLSSNFEKNQSIDDLYFYTKDSFSDFFEESFFNFLLKKRKVLLLWDALDETSNEVRENILIIIEKLRSQGYIQWITCRNYLKRYLEEKFCCFSKQLRPLVSIEQEQFLGKFDFNIDQIENILSLGRDFLKIPLHLNMVSDIFIKRYFGDVKNFSILKFYKKFFKTKIELYYQEKGNVDFGNRFLEKMIEQHTKLVMQNYEKVSLKVLDLHLDIPLDLDLEDFHENEDSFGIIEIDEGKPRFIHHSFGEYFAAHYIFKNQRNISNLITFMFEENYNNLRFFFDHLMAEDSVQHLAVLQKNFKLLANNDKVSDKDFGGRTPLHIACSWGLRYPRLKVDFSENLYIVDDSHSDSISSEDFDYKNILEFLLQKCNTREIDNLFKMTPLEYASKTNNLFAKIKILQKQNEKLTKFDDDSINMLYYSVKFGWLEIFSIIEDFHLIVNSDKDSLLHIACKQQNFDFFKILLNKLGSAINLTNKYGHTPFHIAIQCGNHEIARALIEQGADIFSYDNTSDSMTPLHLACQNANLNCVKMLLDFGADVNIANSSHMTPLHLACLEGNEECIKLLIYSGADVNQALKDGRTALHLACEKNFDSVVTLLLEYGADLNLVNLEKRTPLDIAIQRGFDGIVKILTGRGG